MLRSKIYSVFIFVILLIVPVRLLATTFEYELKAAFIFNFAKFVKWTNPFDIDQRDTLPLCILGKDPFGTVIDRLEGKKVQDYILHIKRIAAVEDNSDCRILFISKSETDRLSTLLTTLEQKKGILTISDIKGFANSGGVIELVLNKNRVQFIVNIAAAKDSELYLSSKILRLATVIGSEKGGN